MLKKTLRSSLMIAGLAVATLSATPPAQAQIRIGVGAYPGYHGPVYRFAGEDYCWYEDAWRGPGWYVCGSQWRRGFGWGGQYGWHGWHPRPHHHPHGPRPQPGPGRPPVGGHPGPSKPPVGAPPGSPKPPRGGHPGGGHPNRPPVAPR